MRELGPVSRHLEAELREFARQYGIVVWLDKEGLYTEFCHDLVQRAQAGAFPFPVRAFRGSFLQLMLELDGLQDGVGMTPLLIHVPQHNEEDIRRTPLLELYRAGRRHRRALPTLVKEAAHGRATVEQLEAFLARPDLKLDSADRWLEGLTSPTAPHAGPDLSELGAEALFDAVLRGELASDAAQRAVWRRAQLLLGLAHDPEAKDPVLEIAGWAMYVEFVHDLQRPPKDTWLAPIAKLPKPVVQACQRLAVHIRDHHAARYTQLADEIEERLVAELRDATAEDLGNVDTFRFEDRKIFGAALEALAAGTYQGAHDWAVARLEGFWAREDRERNRGWQLVLLAAELGRVLDAHVQLLEGARDQADAVERYSRGGYQVDAAHRLLEQARDQASILELVEFPTLRQRLDDMRRAYRRWADRQARAFNALCKAEGFLPPPSLRQRELFDEVVHPYVKEDGVTAYFMVDAMRFELGEQLARQLASTRTADVVLKARLAELPTVTEVGMNVLAPLSVGGKLRPDLSDKGILGFRAQEARIATPEERRKVIQERVGGSKCPKLTLEDVLSRDIASLRRSIADARLVVVHSEGIDKAGEKGVGLVVFDKELNDLRSAWRQLYEAGVRRFVFTADHGFLLHDPVTRAPRPHGFKTEPKRRHVLSSTRLEREGEVCVSARELGYEGMEAWFLFPEDAAPFDLGERAKDLVHGGNSLQERVIPVITVRHRHAAGVDAARYQLEAQVGQPLARMHCLTATIRFEKGHTLAFSSPAELELTLECADDPNVQVELCDARGARVSGSSVFAAVEKTFELYFRLRGVSGQRVRVRMTHAARVSNVAAFETAERFDVEVRPGSMAPAGPALEAPAQKPRGSTEAWLLDLPEGGVREVFRQLMVHGSINEEQATRLLGGPRQFRKFSRELDSFMAVAPFRVRVEGSSGTKCYVRGEG